SAFVDGGGERTLNGGASVGWSDAAKRHELSASFTGLDSGSALARPAADASERRVAGIASWGYRGFGLSTYVVNRDRDETFHDSAQDIRERNWAVQLSHAGELVPSLRSDVR